jgi:hypothetical protein
MQLLNSASCGAYTKTISLEHSEDGLIYIELIYDEDGFLRQIIPFHADGRLVKKPQVQMEIELFLEAYRLV